MLGHWKNYDELESNLSIDELMATLKASREKEQRERKFFAAINGVDLDDSTPIEDSLNDVLDLNQKFVAREEGFGLDEGLGFMQMGG